MKSILKKVSGIVCTALLAMVVAGCNHTVNTHDHTYDTEWTSDGTYHWHAATCEHAAEVADKAAHKFGEWSGGKRVCSECEYEQVCEHTWDEGEVTKAPTEETEGEKTYTCKVCELEKKETIAKLDHVHAKGAYHAAVAGTCETKGTLAFYDCVKSTCGIKLDENGNPLVSIEGELDPSNHTGTATTWTKTAATHKETYDCCGAIKTVEAVHTWNAGVVTKAATVSSEGEITYSCNVCQKTKTEKVPAFGWCETPIDAETGMSATADSEYVLFGMFPKTIKATDVTFDPEPETFTMGANTYYKAKDGKYYAKVTPKKYDYGYKYSDGTTVLDYGTVYFLVEPIKWKVLTKDYNGTGKALLLAEDILTANVPYYNYNSSSNTRTVGSDTSIYPNNYKYSQIRAYLNGLDYYYDRTEKSTEKKTDYTDMGFLQTAFTAAAQEKIERTTVDNSASSTTDAGGNIDQAIEYKCDDTQDKIFLLSEKEVTTKAYGFAAYDSTGVGNARIRKPTDYAKANYAYQSSIDGEGGRWFTRSPSFNGRNGGRYVSETGNNEWYYVVYYTQYGVVPALTISLERN